MENTRKVIFCKDCEFFELHEDYGSFCCGACKIWGQNFSFHGLDFCSHAREPKTLLSIYEKYPENSRR